MSRPRVGVLFARDDLGRLIREKYGHSLLGVYGAVEGLFIFIYQLQQRELVERTGSEVFRSRQARERAVRVKFASGVV